MRSAGFGNTRIYVNFDRLTESDMASYNVYVSTDRDEVLSMTDPTATVSQASSGSTMTAEVGGLVNGTTYFIAMEGVDEGGNTSENRTNKFADGTVATGLPEATVGPAGLLGEKGCALVPGEGLPSMLIFALAAPLALILVVRIRRARRILIFLVVASALLTVSAGELSAQEGAVTESEVAATGLRAESPQLGFLEVGVGFWIPKSGVLDSFFGKCCNVMPKIQGGVLFQKRYGAELGVGFLYKSGAAVGQTSGQKSQDRFNFILVPIETNFAWRADYFTWRALVPYLKVGGDYVYFREGESGGSIQGWKFGVHGEGGIQINLGEIADVRQSLDGDFGINDFFMTLGARYQWINSFGKKGLDLSGPVFSLSFLFEF